MAGTALLFGRVMLRVLFVVRLDVVVADRGLRFQCLVIEHDIFDFDLFGNHELLAVFFVISLQHLIGHLDLRHKIRCLEQQLLHHALLVIQVGQPRCQRLGRKCRGLNGTVQLLQSQIVTQARFVQRRRHALGSQQFLVANAIEFAIGAGQARHLQNRLLQYPVRNRQAHARGFGRQRPLRDQVFEDFLFHLRRIEHRRIEARPIHLAESIHLLALRRIPVLLGDGLARDLGHVIFTAPETAVAFQVRKTQTTGK